MASLASRVVFEGIACGMRLLPSIPLTEIQHPPWSRSASVLARASILPMCNSGNPPTAPAWPPDDSDPRSCFPAGEAEARMMLRAESGFSPGAVSSRPGLCPLLRVWQALACLPAAGATLSCLLKSHQDRDIVSCSGLLISDRYGKLSRYMLVCISRFVRCLFLSFSCY